VNCKRQRWRWQTCFSQVISELPIARPQGARAKMFCELAFAFLRSWLRIFPSLVYKPLEFCSQKMLNVFFCVVAVG
jgi:hypothetical protein